MIWLSLLALASAAAFVVYFIFVCLVHTGRWPWERP